MFSHVGAERDGARTWGTSSNYAEFEQELGAYLVKAYGQ